MPIKILMVCLGNICRSPLAEGILRHKTKSEKILVDSAGTAGYHIGKKPDHRSIAIAQENGIDISNQRCRQVTTKDFEDFDKIYVMDKNNYNNVIALAGSEEQISKVKLILNEISLSDLEVPDPYYDDNGFTTVFNMLSEACEIIAKNNA